MINTDNLERAKQMIKKSEKPVIIMAQNDNFNRKILEYGKFDVLLSAERGERKDGLRQLDSGLNHVLTNIAAKNKVAIGIDMEEIRGLKGKEGALRIGKIQQNLRICRKSGCDIVAINYKDKKDAFSFLISLGASTQQANKAISF